MKLDFRTGWLAMLAALTLFGTGCSGIDASRNVSPATFFLPGFGQTLPESVHPAPNVPDVTTVAQAN